MQLRVFGLSFFAAYLVCANGLSQCVWHCNEDINSYFFQLPPVNGQPPEMRCVHFPNKYGRWLYTDLGVNATETRLGDLLPYRIYSKITCDENCWVENGPIPFQDAVYFESYATVIENGFLRSYRCLSITNPGA